MDMAGYQAVTLVLSIAALIFPMIFGYIVYRMTKIFVTSREFEDFLKRDYEELKKTMEQRRQETNAWLQRIQEKIEKLLERTAGPSAGRKHERED